MGEHLTGQKTFLGEGSVSSHIVGVTPNVDLIGSKAGHSDDRRSTAQWLHRGVAAASAATVTDVVVVVDGAHAVQGRLGQDLGLAALRGTGTLPETKLVEPGRLVLAARLAHEQD